MAGLIGRSRERSILAAALESSEAELIGIYGRRRVGKTFLIREFYGAHIHFELVGIHAAPVSEQLQNFARARSKALRAPLDAAAPRTWAEAFAQLASDLERLPRSPRKRVLFFDEIPWLASRRSGFLRAFEHFWNAW